jgi:hypothetical protein
MRRHLGWRSQSLSNRFMNVSHRSEDHTEQNRYLRKYASVPSAVDHLHSVYSAHVTTQVRVCAFFQNIEFGCSSTISFDLIFYFIYYRILQCCQQSIKGSLSFSERFLSFIGILSFEQVVGKHISIFWRSTVSYRIFTNRILHHDLLLVKGQIMILIQFEQYHSQWHWLKCVNSRGNIFRT